MQANAFYVQVFTRLHSCFTHKHRRRQTHNQIHTQTHTQSSVKGAVKGEQILKRGSMGLKRLLLSLR